MKNCLVTKLKGTVNNPNLPILETMQQFTLDAIAASGNNNMTDEQKVALNHLFYQVGAITDNDTWAKIKVLAIPVLATPSSECTNNLVWNYKNNSNMISVKSFSNFTGINGGLESNRSVNESLLMTLQGISTANASLIVTYSPGSSVTNDSSKKCQVSINYNNDGTIESFAFGPQTNNNGVKQYISSGLYVSPITSVSSPVVLQTTNIKGTPWGDDTIDIAAYSSDGMKYVPANLNITGTVFKSHEGQSVASVKLQMDSAQTLGMLLVSESLTDIEMNNIVEASLRLRSAFGN